MNQTASRAAQNVRGGGGRKAVPADAGLKAAIAHHQAGRLDEAKRLYAEILSREPKHVKALHLLGVIEYQEGDTVQATALIGNPLSPMSECAAIATWQRRSDRRSVLATTALRWARRRP